MRVGNDAAERLEHVALRTQPLASTAVAVAGFAYTATTDTGGADERQLAEAATPSPPRYST